MTPDQQRARSTRLVARQLSELFLERAQRWSDLTSHDQLDGLIYMTVLSGSVSHLPLRDPANTRWYALEDAERFGRPVAIAGIAESLALPYSTLRRRVSPMVAADLLLREPAGYRASASLAQRLYTDGGCARFSKHLGVLAEAGYAPARNALASGVADIGSGVVERQLAAFHLRTVEPLTRVYGNVGDAMIVAAIVAANVRHVTTDVVLSRRYAAEDSLPPDEVRRAISVRELARTLQLPFETMRRRVAALIARELVERRSDGVVVPTRVLAVPGIAQYNSLMIAFFEQLLDTLVTAVPAL